MSNPEIPQFDADQSPFEQRVVYAVPELSTKKGAERVLGWLKPRIRFPLEDGGGCDKAYIADEKTGVTFEVPLKGSFYFYGTQDRDDFVRGGATFSIKPVIEYDGTATPNSWSRSSFPNGHTVGYKIVATIWDFEETPETATLDFANMRPIETQPTHAEPVLFEQQTVTAISAALHSPRE